MSVPQEHEEEEEREKEKQKPVPTVGFRLDPADEMMYDVLVDSFGEELIDAELREAVKSRVRGLYDNREGVADEIARAGGL